MATTRHDFWVHGLEAHVQNEPDPISTGYTPNPRRNSQGTRVRQDVGENWFHFALPTPIALQPDTDEHHVELLQVLLRGSGKNCRIKAVHVWSGGAGGGKKICEYDFVASRLLDGEFEEEYDFTTPNYSWRDPLAIDILVEFEGDGDITFGGAGVRFEAEVPDWVYVHRDAPCLSR